MGMSDITLKTLTVAAATLQVTVAAVFFSAMAFMVLAGFGVLPAMP